MTRLDQQSRRCRGQTLILAVLALLILLLAIIFLFDLQHVIRVKVKAQTAVDAAALAGANWQVKSLNLIGDLNLLKACVALTQVPAPDYVPLDFDKFAALTPAQQDAYIQEQLDSLKQAADDLTQMQARVSFVGPLLGFAAAQQAAKNNGVSGNPGFDDVVKAHLDRLQDDGVYGDPPLSQWIQGYLWRSPYTAMIENLLDGQGGIAVSPNTLFHGAPRLDGREPYISYLQDKRIYDAINGNEWCYLRGLLRTMQSDPEASGKWWGEIKVETDSSSFPEESEYLPLDISYFSGYDPFDTARKSGSLAYAAKNQDSMVFLDGQDFYLKDADGHIRRDADGKPLRNPDDTDNLVDLIPRIAWAVYGATWRDDAPGSSWTDAVYLRSELRPEYVYGGAVAKFRCEAELDTLSGFWNSTKGTKQQNLGDALSFSGQEIDSMSFESTGKRLAQAEAQIRTGLAPVYATALAKPLGKLELPEGNEPPDRATMVLPVFEKGSVIPLAMGDPGGIDPFDYRWYAFLTEYLPALGCVNRVEDMGPDVVSDPSHWSWFTYCHAALLKLNDPDWRAQGVAWLAAEATGEDVLDEDGNVIGHVTTSTNEDHCDDWPGGGGGKRDGPSVLH